MKKLYNNPGLKFLTLSMEEIAAANEGSAGDLQIGAGDYGDYFEGADD